MACPTPAQSDDIGSGQSGRRGPSIDRQR